MAKSIQLTPEQTTEIIGRALGLESSSGERQELYGRYREIYHLKNVDVPTNEGVDRNDWKVTPDPSSRNAVRGMKQLLDTSELHIKVKYRGGETLHSAQIERACRRIISESSEGRKARVLSDAILAAVLYGPAILSADSLDDLLAVPGIPAYKKAYLERLKKRTPFLVRAHNPEECWLDHDEGMLVHFHRKFSLGGAQVKTRYGKTDAKENTTYTIRDIFTPEYHIVEIDGEVVMAKKHGLPGIPVASCYAGGTELFSDPDEQIQSFLYAVAKGNLDKRGNSLLTTMFTNIHMRGLAGPLIALDPDSTPDDVVVDYTGGVRFIRAKASPVDDKIVDPVIFEARRVLDDLHGQSTLYRQVLGENIDASTFSSLALLSSSGKLPMIDAQRALEGAFKQMFVYILERIKSEGIKNALVDPSMIPEEYDLEVTFEPRLPQDNLRNAQIAQSLGDAVSDEWKHENLLQVEDSKAMRRQIAKEGMVKAILAAMVQDPELMKQWIGMITGMGQKEPTEAREAPREAPQGNFAVPPEAQEQGYGMPVEAQGQPNMEQQPQTEPMIPPQERM